MKGKLLSIPLFLSPFAIAYLLYYFMTPAGFWQTLGFLIATFLICLMEGFITWIIGIALWDVWR